MPMGVQKACKNRINRKRNEKYNSSILKGGYLDSTIPRRKRTKHKDVSLRDHSDVWKQAKEIQSSLPGEFPSEIRIMLNSYVSGCFWLQLGKKFWHLRLPQENVEMTLEDENGEEYRAKYIWKENALSGGWKGFSVAHKLVEGDALVFQLTRPLTFKVYIVRANDFHHGAVDLLKLHSCSKGVDSDELTNGKESKASKVKEENDGDCLQKDIAMNNTLQNYHKNCVASTEHMLQKIEHALDDPVPDVPRRIRFSKSKVDFKKGGYRDSEIPRRKRTKHKDVNLRNNSDVWKRAKEIQLSLPREFPSEIRIMLSSYVSGCFWLQLGKKFWHLCLPQENVEMALEDENGEEYRAKYIWKDMALSGGWKSFSVAHKLVKGDALIFQLMKPMKFKVYIVRGNASHEADGAAGLTKLDNCSKGIVLEELTNGKELKASKVEEQNNGNCLPKDISMENTPQDNDKKCVASTEHLLHKLEKASYDLVPDVPGGIRLSKSRVDFKKVGSILDFSVVINGLVIDSELSKQVRITYYELCCSQQSFLHDHLLEGLNYKLAAGIISETVNIADAIRASKITTFTENLFSWGQTLKGLEDLGMNVGFIRTRLDKLVKFAIKLKKYREAEGELTGKLFEAKEAGRIDDKLERDGRSLEMAFQEVINAPW